MYKLQAPKIKLSPFSTIRAVAEGASVKSKTGRMKLQTQALSQA